MLMLGVYFEDYSVAQMVTSNLKQSNNQSENVWSTSGHSTVKLMIHEKYFTVLMQDSKENVAFMMHK